MKTRLLCVILTSSVTFASLGGKLSHWLFTWADGS